MACFPEEKFKMFNMLIIYITKFNVVLTFNLFCHCNQKIITNEIIKK